MRIGIDAKWYFEGPPSGKMVIRNLVNEIVKNSQGHEIILFLDKKYEGSPLDIENSSVVKIFLWAGNNLLSNLFFIPFFAWRCNVDAVVYQNFISPFGRHKKIAYIHDIIYLTHPEFYTVFERLYFFPLKFLTKMASLVVTVSQSEKKRISDLKFTDKRIHVVYHGVENRFCKIDNQPQSIIKFVQKKFSLPNEFILYVGRLNSRKNVPNLLRAYASLSKNNIPLVLVGGYDWKSDNLKSLIRDLKIEDKLILTGPVDDDELSAIYSLAKLFCFPSYEEGFGLPPLEAMASGVPVIVANSSSIPEICGDAGSYVDPNNPKEIADMIDLLLNDPLLWSKKKKEGLEQAKKFTWEQSAKTLIDIVEKMK